MSATQEKAAPPQHEAWMQFLAEHPTRGGLAEALIFQAGWQAAEAVNKELLEALEKAAVIIRSAYRTQEWLIAHRSEESDDAQDFIEAAIAKARGRQL